MDNLADMREAVQSDLTVGTGSSLYTVGTIDLALNRAYRKGGGLFLWPETEDAKKTSSKANQDYYDAPQNWRPYTLFRLEVDGYQYGEEPDGSPIAFPDYLIWKKENPNSTEKKWTMQWRRYFITPTPTVNASYNISIWGQKVVDKMEEETDTTIFSYVMPECNEALVLEAVAILKAKDDDANTNVEEFKSSEAKGILARAWDRVNKEHAKLEKNQAAFYVPDFMKLGGTTSKSNIGDF